jgi:methyltransferase (TIGR00027 family)
MLRAFGSWERDPAIRNPDLLGGELAADGGVYRLGLRLASVPVLHACGRWVFERTGPGLYWAEIARVKYFDDVLLGEVSAGVCQVVVLGAGFDSRPYRFRDELSDVHVIEVDHPVTAARKRQRVESVYGGLPKGVTYLSVDLNHEDLRAALAGGGFDPDAPVLVLWVGVSMYLAADVVAGVLGWVGERPAHSSIGFDYMDQSFFDDERLLGGPRRTRFVVGLSGEKLAYGIARSSVPVLLGEHGLAMRSHLGPEEMRAKYLRRSDGRLAGSPRHLGFVHAGVA